MSTSDLFAIDVMLRPVSDENPTGIDLREEPTAEYRSVKEARREIASLSRTGRFDGEGNSSIAELWKKIYLESQTILEQQSKDLEVAAWLTEAGLKIHSFEGLNAGIKLIKGLVNQFWDALFPMPDEDGIETRVYPVTGLNGENGRGTLVVALKSAALTNNKDQPLNLNLYERCVAAEQISEPDAKKQRIQEIGCSLGELADRVNSDEAEFYRRLIENVDLCLNAHAELTAQLDERCGHDSPPSSAIKSALIEIQQLLGSLCKHLQLNEVEAPRDAVDVNAPDALAGAPSHPGMQHAAISTGSVMKNREDAINQLLVIAEFFKKTEPHSPLCGAIERIAGWARMPIQELMMELIPDSNSRGVFAQLTGIPLCDDAPAIGRLASTAKSIETPAEQVNKDEAAQAPGNETTDPRYDGW